MSGTQIALAQDVPWLAASLMGVITGVVGGVARDVLCNQVPVVFGGTLYATASWLGSLLLVTLPPLGVDPLAASWVAMASILALRLAAMHWRIGLPRFSGRR